MKDRYLVRNTMLRCSGLRRRSTQPAPTCTSSLLCSSHLHSLCPHHIFSRRETARGQSSMLAGERKPCNPCVGVWGSVSWYLPFLERERKKIHEFSLPYLASWLAVAPYFTISLYFSASFRWFFSTTVCVGDKTKEARVS